MAWRLAGSLVRLRDQVNAAYTNRSKASDGTIGDTAHAGSASDHNPNSAGVVCAMDITNDPTNGPDMHAMADHIRTHRQPNLKYIISNRRICGAWTGWNWVAYNGENAHNKHVHFSVGIGADGQSKPPYDNTTDWDINYKGEDMSAADANFVNNSYVGILMRSEQPYDPATGRWRDPGAKVWVGQDQAVVQQKLLESDERKQVEKRWNTPTNSKFKPYDGKPLFVEE